MKKNYVLVLLLSLAFLVTMPVIAEDFSFSDSINLELFETTTINIQGEVAISIFNIDRETLSFDNQTLSQNFPANPWNLGTGNDTGTCMIESDDPKNYIYTIGNLRYKDHPSFLGVA